MTVNALIDRGAVARIYNDIKGRILGGELRLSERLDVEDLAGFYKASATPVRQALAHLSFERLIVFDSVRGYRVTLWSEQALHDLYEWRGMLACLAARTYEPAEKPYQLNGALEYADAAAALLQRLNGAANVDVARAAINADERLRAARLVEPEVMPACAAELESLANEMRDGTPETIQAALCAFHQRRAERAADIRAHAVLRSLPDVD
jgi:DNA-binding GntR family transcriptional regulator